MMHVLFAIVFNHTVGGLLIAAIGAFCAVVGWSGGASSPTGRWDRADMNLALVGVAIVAFGLLVVGWW